uniref:CAP-Gly domain-containing protein n=1 Tax=Heligmosomoides polygyrus TaxID=6339 RepID=A0A8L8JN35_HELPZ
LHYVGEVHGKEGLYCGIELETPSGKHDGTYQGVVYFVCPPGHGIFAPLYRVELDEIDDVPMMAVSQTMKGQERLSRSALPALQLRNVFRPEDPMQASIASEQFMEGSTNAAPITCLQRSNFTDNEECDLMSITAPKSILSYRMEKMADEEVMLGTSVVLDESRVGVENLPVVEDDDDVDDEDDDLQTPLVEARPQWQPLSSFAPPPSIIESLGSPSVDGSQEAPEKEPVLRVNSRQSDDTGYNGESDASRLEHDDPPPPPKFPVKPKPPSKHQLLMEQIKASIEAEKLKPKKEIKARVSLLPPPRAPPPQNENTTDEKMPETPKRTLKQPLKTVNAAPPPKPAVERPKKEQKPLYVPPPPKGDFSDKERKTPAKTSTPIIKNGEKTIDTPNVSKIEDTPTKTPAKGKTQFPTSSFAGGKLGPKSRPSVSGHSSKSCSRSPAEICEYRVSFVLFATSRGTVPQEFWKCVRIAGINKHLRRFIWPCDKEDKLGGISVAIEGLQIFVQVSSCGRAPHEETCIY